MDPNSRPRDARRASGVVFTCALCLVASWAGQAGAEAEQIVLRPTDPAEAEEIRTALGATRVERLRSGGEIWEVPAGTRDGALTRYRNDDRLDYIGPLDGNARQVFADRPVTGDLSPQQNETIARLSARATTGELRTAALQADQFTADLIESSTADRPPIEFNLLPGKKFQAKGRRVERHPRGFTWYGNLVDDGKATLVVRGEDITGLVRVEGKRYSIKPLGGGLHAVYEVNQEAFPPEHSPRFKQTMQRDRPAMRASAATSNPNADSAPPRIDVMVVYPSSLDSAFVEMDVQLAIDRTNETYEMSGVLAKLELVHHQALTYAESGKTESDLAALESSQGGLSSVPALRDEHGADLVVMLVANADYCGEAADIMASDLKAYAVVREDCATENLSFPHEVGHLFGARHDVGTDPKLTPFKYGHGHLVGGTQEEDQSVLDWVVSWFTSDDEPAEEELPTERTIMAYGDGCGNCERIEFWSTPRVEYRGRPLGTEELEDNVRVLNEMAPTVAAFRSESGP